MRVLFFLIGLMCFVNPSVGQSTLGGSSSTNAGSTVPNTAPTPSTKAKNTYEKPLAQPGATLPSFAFLTSDERVYFDTSLRKNTPLILVLFNPSCGHCMEVAVNMKSRIQALSGADIVFLTGNNLLAELPSFIQQTRIYGLPNVYVGIDHSDVSKQLFEYNGIPQIMVYNKNRILLKTYYKQIDLDEIVQLIRTE